MTLIKAMTSTMTQAACLLWGEVALTVPSPDHENPLDGWMGGWVWASSGRTAEFGSCTFTKNAPLFFDKSSLEPCNRD